MDDRCATCGDDLAETGRRYVRRRPDGRPDTTCCSLSCLARVVDAESHSRISPLAD